MSGKRQHFIPQFIQRPFSSSVDGAVSKAWVYRKSKSPFESSIRNIGVGTYFYSRPDNTFLDDIITKAECEEYSILVSKIRQQNAISNEDALALPGLFSHLQSRSRNIRQNVASVGEVVISYYLDQFSDIQFMRNFMVKLIRYEPERILGTENMRGMNISITKKTQLLKMMAKGIENGAMDDKIFALTKFFESRKCEIPKLCEDATAAGQRKTLSDSIEPEFMVNKLGGLDFEIVPCIGMPLSDAMILFLVCAEKERSYKTVLSSADNIELALLPISPELMIVGQKFPQQLDLIEIKDRIIASSYEFFISNEKTEDNEFAAQKIGTNSNLFSAREMEENLKKLTEF